MSEYPRLRHLEAFAVHQDGRDFVAMRDPAGYTDAVVLVPRPLATIVGRFDGQHSIVDIQAEIMRDHGELVPAADIEQMVAMLDQHGFMESQAFAQRRAAIEQAFLEAPLRPPAHAGGAYPAEPGPLRQALDGCFAPPDGPGPRAGEPAAGPPVRGLIAPHIDFHRGGPAYAWGYRELGERAEGDLFLVFGTCHTGMADPFALTRKDYDTPLGAAPVDREFVEALARRAGQDCFASELAHRSEHSIEFQAVWLRYLYAERREIAVVPVLASFAHEALLRGQRPDDDPRVPRFLDAVRETIAASGRRVTVIAGADLAHVGPRFGDPELLDSAACARLAAEDQRMLAAVTAGDAEAFFGAVAADGDRRRICGLSPIYALLRVLDRPQGDLRRYAQTPDPQCVVTFASVVFQ